MSEVAKAQQVGFINVFDATNKAMRPPELTSRSTAVISTTPVTDCLAGWFLMRHSTSQPGRQRGNPRGGAGENKQFFRRFRPVNTFYYTGGRNRSYGYLDFLPAMRNFDIMTANRDQRIWDIAAGKQVSRRSMTQRAAVARDQAEPRRESAAFARGELGEFEVTRDLM